MTLSIITVNKNNAAGLEKTIQSVVCQTSHDYEYIIIDGASDDESVNIIKKHANKINYWVSEPDTGIYNAMNKGIRKAQGDYCLFLNSGDWLIEPKTLENVFSEIKGKEADIFYSDKSKSDNTLKQYPYDLSLMILVKHTINHQNTLIKRSLFSDHGFYNENLAISSDWEFILFEFWKYKNIFNHIKTNIAIFDVNGIGSSETLERTKEALIVFKNVFNDNQLSETFFECYKLNLEFLKYKKFKKTVYYDIINNFGDTRILNILLRIYRRFYKLINKK